MLGDVNCHPVRRQTGPGLRNYLKTKRTSATAQAV